MRRRSIRWRARRFAMSVSRLWPFWPRTDTSRRMRSIGSRSQLRTARNRDRPRDGCRGGRAAAARGGGNECAGDASVCARRCRSCAGTTGPADQIKGNWQQLVGQRPSPLRSARSSTTTHLDCPQRWGSGVAWTETVVRATKASVAIESGIRAQMGPN
jgi:hypothetical protein